MVVAIVGVVICLKFTTFVVATTVIGTVITYVDML